MHISLFLQPNQECRPTKHIRAGLSWFEVKLELSLCIFCSSDIVAVVGLIWHGSVPLFASRPVLHESRDTADVWPAR